MMSIISMDDNSALVRRFHRAAANGAIAQESDRAGLQFYFAQAFKSPVACEDWLRELETILKAKIRPVNGGKPGPDAGKAAGFVLGVGADTPLPDASTIANNAEFKAWCVRKANQGLWQLVRIGSGGHSVDFSDGDPQSVTSTSVSMRAPTDQLDYNDMAANMQAVLRTSRSYSQAADRQKESFQALEKILVPLVGKLKRGIGLSDAEFDALDTAYKNFSLQRMAFSGNQGLVEAHIRAILQRGKRDDSHVPGTQPS